MSALIAEGKIPPIKDGRGGGKADKTKQVVVGKRGSIIISKELVAGEILSRFFIVWPSENVKRKH